VNILGKLPRALRDANLLVGSDTGDDAGVYRIAPDRALVQTVDFFTPIVDDPFLYGQIAAANSLSDVYAMGGRPLTAMNIMGVPTDILGPEIIAAILRGGASKVREAKCALVGGHTIRNPEPVYGLSVTGIVHPRRMITNAAARRGDLLVLTKPLGTGIITTGIKRGLTSAVLAKKAVRCMSQLNTAGAAVAARGLVRAGTDVTGFGLLGHLSSLCKSSGVSAELAAGALPVISREVWKLIAQDCIPGGTRENLEAAEGLVDWDNSVTSAQKYLLADAQTSGGLMLCVAPGKLAAVLKVFKKHRTLCAEVIGRIVPATKARIFVKP
jgi:selenide,water dikinase